MLVREGVDNPSTREKRVEGHNNLATFWGGGAVS